MFPARRRERSLVVPNKRSATTLGTKLAPALGNCSCIALIPYVHVSIRVAAKNPPLCVACMDAGEVREQDAVSFARRSFGITKPLSSRLDWQIFSRNRLHLIGVNRP